MKFYNNKYTPPEKIIALEEGSYPFKIISAEEKTSRKSGNDMIEIYLCLNPGQPEVGRATDWIVDSEKMTWKRKHLLYAIGKGDLWEKREFSANDLLNATGYCIVTKQRKEKDNPNDLSMVNRVKDYVCDDSVKVADVETEVDVAIKHQAPFTNDDIPF